MDFSLALTLKVYPFPARTRLNFYPYYEICIHYFQLLSILVSQSSGESLGNYYGTPVYAIDLAIRPWICGSWFSFAFMGVLPRTYVGWVPAS